MTLRVLSTNHSKPSMHHIRILRSSTTQNYLILQDVALTTCALSGTSATPYSTDAFHAVARIMSGVGTRYASLINNILSRFNNVYAFASPNMTVSYYAYSLPYGDPTSQTGHNGDDAWRNFASIGSIGNYSTCDVQPIRW